MSFDKVNLFLPSEAGDHYNGQERINDIFLGDRGMIEFHNGQPRCVSFEQSHYRDYLRYRSVLFIMLESKKFIIGKHPILILEWDVG